MRQFSDFFLGLHLNSWCCWRDKVIYSSQLSLLLLSNSEWNLGLIMWLMTSSCKTRRMQTLTASHFIATAWRSAWLLVVGIWLDHWASNLWMFCYWVSCYYRSFQYTSDLAVLLFAICCLAVWWWYGCLATVCLYLPLVSLPVPQSILVCVPDLWVSWLLPAVVCVGDNVWAS